MEAAFKTSQLVDLAIMVTKDDTYLEYPTSRHISFAYENIIKGGMVSDAVATLGLLNIIAGELDR